MDRVGNLKLGTGCWNSKMSFFHRPLAVFLSTYGQFFLGWVIHRIWAILLFLLPLDGSYIVWNPLHLPTFWMINLQNYSRKDEGIHRAGSNPPFPSFLFQYLPACHCRQLDSSRKILIIVLDPTILLSRNRHNLSSVCANDYTKVANSKFQI